MHNETFHRVITKPFKNDFRFQDPRESQQDSLDNSLVKTHCTSIESLSSYSIQSERLKVTLLHAVHVLSNSVFPFEIGAFSLTNTWLYSLFCAVVRAGMSEERRTLFV